MSAHVTTADLEFLSNLIEAGKMRPQIDRRYPFTEIPQQSLTWNKATPEGRSSWARREERPGDSDDPGCRVRNISRGGQPSEGVTVATKTAKITNPTVGRRPGHHQQPLTPATRRCETG